MSLYKKHQAKSWLSGLNIKKRVIWAVFYLTRPVKTCCLSDSLSIETLIINPKS